MINLSHRAARAYQFAFLEHLKKRSCGRMKIYSALLLSFLLSSTYGQELQKLISIEPIPHPLEWVLKPEAFRQEGESITIDAGPNTNMFYSPHGSFRVSNMPKLLFQPKGDFSLQAKAQTKHQSKWDAAMLVAYVDEDFWAKLCFENQDPGIARMVTVVTNEISDDAYSDLIDGGSVYMKIEKQGAQIVFSYSKNGVDWIAIRYFRLNSGKPLKIGFSSQSPVGQGLRSVFSEIKYQEAE